MSRADGWAYGEPQGNSHDSRAVERIKLLFAAARDQQPSHRAAFVVRECVGDEDLQSQVMHLLSHSDEAKDFLEHSFLQAENLIGSLNRPTIFFPD